MRLLVVAQLQIESDWVREAIAHYLGETSPESVARMNQRLQSLERQLSKLQRVVMME